MVFPSLSLNTPSGLEADSEVEDDLPGQDEGEEEDLTGQDEGEEDDLDSGDSGSGSCLMTGAGARYFILMLITVM